MANDNFAKDLSERVFWTFVQGVAGTVTATGFNLIDVNGWKMAGVAALPAVYAVVKGGIAKFVGDHNTAAMLPKQESAV